MIVKALIFPLKFEPINIGKVEDCSISERDKARSGVVIESVSFLGEESGFECEGGEKNKVIMLNGKGVFKCTAINIPNDVHYSVPLYIKMNYGYVKSMNKVITLKKDV